MEVVTGMYDGDEEDDDVSMMTGDVYDMHFVRERRTVKLRSSSGEQYLLPFNSFFKISLIHGSSSTAPVKCSTVEEIAQLNPVPKVMAASASYITSNPFSSVSAGEVLAFSVLSSASADTKGATLRAYSITCQQEKFLDPQCRGEFSTDVESTAISLTDALNHIDGLFPSEIVISHASPLLPQALFKKPATLSGLSTVRTVVATLFAEDAGDDIVIEIPSDSEVEVRVLQLDHKSTEQLLTEHAKLLAAYDETLVKFRKNSADPKRLIRGQSNLFNAVTTRFKVPIVEDLKPAPIAGSPNIKDQTAAPACEKPVSSLPVDKVEELTKLVAALTSRCDSLESETTSLRLQLKQIKMMMNKSDTVASTTTLNEPEFKPSCSSPSLYNQSANRSYLTSLSIEQVMQLLEFIGLPQYRNIFGAEGVTGEVLLRLDDDGLKSDLKIASSVHRARIMAVVSGQQSVCGLAGLLTGSDV